MSALRLLQVCNVGRIVGGTAACAWTIMRALPEFEHVVAFLSDVDNETRHAFGDVQVERWPQCALRQVAAARPDVVILHNIGGREPLCRSAVTLQYVHSAGERVPADVTVYCSRWLAEQMGRTPDDVLWQGVPRPMTSAGGRTRGGDRLIIGRICTPTARKWPRSLPAFYRQLAARAPDSEWEFVGCPTGLQAELLNACSGQARFFAAGWSARSRLWDWDALLYHHPALTESFGRIVAESLRAGCIPIMDARGGFVEQVTAETGFLCADSEQFAAAVDRLRDTSLRERMSAAGRESAERWFSIAAFRDRLLARIQMAAMAAS